MIEIFFSGFIENLFSEKYIRVTLSDLFLADFLLAKFAIKTVDQELNYFLGLLMVCFLQNTMCKGFNCFDNFPFEIPLLDKLVVLLYKGIDMSDIYIRLAGHLTTSFY